MIMITSAIAGCLGGDEEEATTSTSTSTSTPGSNCPTTGDALKIAFEVQDDYTNAEENPELLAAYLCEQLGMPVTLYKITSSGAAVEALRFGNAHLAFLDGGPAWMGWQLYDLGVLAADLKSDGRMSYDAHAWVLKDSEMATAHLDNDASTDPFALLQGKTSCHTGWLKSAGMLLPMGYLIGNNYTDVVGDVTDIESLRATIYNFFNANASIPDSGTPYYGYGGAVKCLSDGTGDVAFAKHSTIDTYCNNEVATDNEDWCLSLDQYVPLDKFGSSPSHMAMYNPTTMDTALQTKVQTALVGLDNKSILENILNNEYGMSATNANAHLGTYGAALEDVPGILTYFGGKYGINATDSTSTGTDDSGSTDTGTTDTNTCPTTGDALKIAFEVQDDYTNADENPAVLAQKICEEIGMPVTLYPITSSGAALEALRFGNAHVAFLDGGPAWMGWQMYDLDVLAADLKDDGRMSYDAHAWVRNGSEMAIAQLDDDPRTDPFSLLAGKTSCHTGWLKSAGMLLPMGYLIGNGYANVIGDPTDVESLRATIYNFFNTDASIPDSGTPYYGYGGAVKCLSDGTGDVAFAKHSTVDSYCNNEVASDNEDWCLSLDQYVPLDKFGSSPSHMAMYNPNTMNAALKAKVQSALVGLGNESYLENYDMGGTTYTGCYSLVSHQVDTTSAKNLCGSEILKNVLNNENGMAVTDAATHIGSYGDALEDVPGIMAYFGGKYAISNATAPAKRAIKVAFEIKDDYTNADENPALLAAHLSAKMGVDVTLYPTTSEGAALQALRFGNADIAFMDGGSAWLGWKEYGLAAMAADLKGDGRPYYDAHAWVKKGSAMANAHEDNDPSTDPFELLRGKISCHTGWLKSAGMLLPMGYLISNGYAQVQGDASDIDSLRSTINAFFDGSTSSASGTEASIPESGTPYYGYGGAVKCLSEGVGDVAFAKDSTIDSYCNNTAAEDNEDWCLALDQYVKLPAFGQAPSHPVMYNPARLDIQTRTAILSALLSLNDEIWVTEMNDDGADICYNMVTHAVNQDNQSVCEAYAWYENAEFGGSTFTGCYNMVSHQANQDNQSVCEAYAYYEDYGATVKAEYCYNKITHAVDSTSAKNTCGSEIMANILNTDGLIEVNTQVHMGTYSKALSSIPGIFAYYEAKYPSSGA